LHNHPQNRFLEVETQNGMVKMLGQGALINNTPATVGKVPQLGEHTAKIREEFAL
jgi:crotonobetainyl-CoA:carnitine CoA-transferase CaiB-like acyl-CoA transferase